MKASAGLLLLEPGGMTPSIVRTARVASSCEASQRQKLSVSYSIKKAKSSTLCPITTLSERKRTNLF
jgi:hypothetical protein